MPVDLFQQGASDGADAGGVAPRDLFAQSPQQPSAPSPSMPSVGRTMLDQGLQGVPLVGTFADEAAGTLGGLGAKVYDKIMGEHLFDKQNPLELAAMGREDARQNVNNELQQRPILSIASQLASGVATGVAGTTPKTLWGAATNTGIRGGINAIAEGGQMLTNNLRDGNLATRFGKGIVAGAAGGASYGAGAADPGQRIEGAEHGAALGAAVGGAAPIVGVAAGSIAEGAKTLLQGINAKGPEALDSIGAGLKQISSGLYGHMKDANVQISPEATKIIASNINSALKDELGSLDPVAHKGTISALRGIEDAINGGPEEAPTNGVSILSGLEDASPPGAISLNRFDQVRQVLSNINPLDRADVKAAAIVRNALDDSINGLTKDSLTNGAPESVDMLNQARAQWATAKKFETVSDIIQKSDGDPNKIKSRLNSLLNNDRKISGFTDNELAALKEAAKSSKPEYILKGLGRFGFEPKNVYLPLVAGHLVAGPVGSSLVATGTVARQAGKYMARGKAQNLLNTIQSGGAPLVSGQLPPLSPTGIFPNTIQSASKSALYAAALNHNQ